MAFLPEKDREYLDAKGVVYEEHVQGSQKGVILKGFSLPNGRFDAEAADVLILLPPGYPDAPPDMFYTLPWLKLAGGAATRGGLTSLSTSMASAGSGGPVTITNGDQELTVSGR